MGSPEQNLGFADISSSASNPEKTKSRPDEPENPEDFSGAPIVETDESVSFLGVGLEKGKGGPEVPSRERFQDIERTLTNEDLRQMQQIAVALRLKQPILIEEYSGSGKTTKVEHMCSLLNTEVHYANCHDFDADVLIGKMSTDETTKSGFGWQDGVVMSAVRNGGVLFLDEYNFMRGDVRARMHEILDSLLRDKENISLIENNHEIVPVHPKLRIVAAQNPPGGEFGDREVLDPAQYTRFVQIKGPSKMPKETKLARALGFVNRDNEITIQQAEYLTSETKLTPEQLAEIPGVEEILRKFIEFEESFEEMVKNRQIGADQSQPIYTAFQRDLDRCWQFVQMFYNGDINDTFQKALRYYYSNRLESDLDRKKVEEQIRHVAYVPETESKRKGLEKEPKPKRTKKAETAPVGELKFEKLTPEIIEKQYNEQIEALEAVGIYKTLSSDKIGFEAEGVEYPVLPLEKVLAHLSESPEFQELLTKKEKQGFQRVRISPFNMPLSEMIEKINEKVVVAGGEKRYLSSSWQGDLSQLKYFTKLNKKGEITGGQTKAEILADLEKNPFIVDGYIISVVEEGDDLPRREDIVEPTGERSRIKGGEKGIDYLKKFADPVSEYSGESPSVTPEEWLSLFSEAMHKKYLASGKKIEESGSDIFDTKSASWFIDSRFSSGYLPYALWNPDYRQVNLNDIGPESSGASLAPRPALRRKS